ncbi:hypothetical protein Fmac_015248 [Flemingia macrophylla]|uniref:Uncharacterized protein n=1 Tax=Flemingia macrophylla TaxID=520843 RepID=A0ABD1ME17_9FABA
MTTTLVSVLFRSNLEWMSILRFMLQTHIADHHNNRDKALDREDGSQPLARFSARNDVIVIRGVHDIATDTSAEARKLEGKLDALVSLVTQLDVNQKPASVAKVFGIRSSNDHHPSVCPSSQQSGVDEHPEAYAANTGVHDVATDTSAEARKLEGKLDALVSLVTQLAANQKPASVARVFDSRSSNDHHTSQFSARNDVIVNRGVHDVATDTCAQARKLEGKLDALVSLVTQLAVNDKPASVARQFSARNDTIVITGVNDVATDTSTEARKLEGKLDATVSLVALLAANQKPASVARQFSARNDPVIIIGVHDVATDTSAKARKLEGKQDAPVSLVAQLTANQKSASIARFSARNDAIVIRGVHDVATDTSAEARKLEGKLGALVKLHFSARNDAIVIRGVHDVATDTSAEARKLEGKLGAHVNLVTQLTANQKPASVARLAVNQKPAAVARICGIRSSNDHHTSVCHSSQRQSGVDKHPEAYALQTPSDYHKAKKDKALDREDGS